jgi:hypothetical protein
MTMTTKELRQQGIGHNFKVLDPADGYRQDNTLWFGNCENCGEGVTSSLHDKGVWMHTEILAQDERSKTTRQIDYCPSSKV